MYHKTGTEHTDPHVSRRNRLRNGPRPFSLRSTSDELDALRRSQECPICENGTRTENHRRRRHKLRLKTGGKRNRKEFLNQPPTHYDRDNERPQFNKNIGVPRASTPRPDI